MLRKAGSGFAGKKLLFAAPLLVLLAAFGFSSGFFLGSGNYHGLVGAILPGIVAGLIVSVPSLKESDWVSAALLVGCALIGAIVASQLSDHNRLTRLCREQKLLVVHIGDYKLGTNSDK